VRFGWVGRDAVICSNVYPLDETEHKHVRGLRQIQRRDVERIVEFAFEAKGTFSEMWWLENCLYELRYTFKSKFSRALQKILPELSR